MKINEKIRQLREQHQLSQENMADKLGMSVTGYAKIERGEVRSNLLRLEQISEVFDMDICELLSYGETEKVYFNKDSFFDNVPSYCWEFKIGAYNPLHKWLKDRKNRSLSDEEVIHYQKMVGAISKTIAIIEEIDRIISI